MPKILVLTLGFQSFKKRNFCHLSVWCFVRRAWVNQDASLLRRLIRAHSKFLGYLCCHLLTCGLKGLSGGSLTSHSQFSSPHLTLLLLICPTSCYKNSGYSGTFEALLVCSWGYLWVLTVPCEEKQSPCPPLHHCRFRSMYFTQFRKY